MKKNFSIQFEGLSLGSHQFEFEIDRTLFSDAEVKEIREAEIKVELDLNKSSNMMDLDVHFKGSFVLPCDRCNEDLRIPIDNEARLIVKYGQVEHEDFEDLMVLDDHEHEIDLSGFFYENLSLMIPQRNVHEESECDPKIVAYLKNKNEGGQDEIDPRWQKLKSI